MVAATPAARSSPTKAVSVINQPETANRAMPESRVARIRKPPTTRRPGRLKIRSSQGFSSRIANLPAGHQQHPVGQGQKGLVVGRENEGFASDRQFMQGLQYKHLTVAIQARSGFIQQNQIVIRQKDTGQTEASGLAAGESLSLFRHRAIDSLLPAVQKGTKAHVTQRRFNRNIGGIRSGQSKVIGPGALNQKTLLPQPAKPETARCFAEQMNFTGVRRHEAGQKM